MQASQCLQKARGRWKMLLVWGMQGDSEHLLSMEIRETMDDAGLRSSCSAKGMGVGKAEFGAWGSWTQPMVAKSTTICTQNVVNKVNMLGATRGRQWKVGKTNTIGEAGELKKNNALPE